MRLKNDAAGFAASFNITPPYQLSVIHSSKLIYPREIYQRGVERKRVELIARDFNEYIVNEPKVSFRNGRYYVMDGQHTIEGCILLNGGADRPILCKVYTGLTVEHLQEMLGICRKNAYLLVKQNKIHSARVGRSYKIPKLCVVEYLLDQDRQLGGMHLSNSLVPSLQNTPESSKLMMPKQRTFGCEQKGA